MEGSPIPPYSGGGKLSITERLAGLPKISANVGNYRSRESGTHLSLNISSNQFSSDKNEELDLGTIDNDVPLDDEDSVNSEDLFGSGPNEVLNDKARKYLTNENHVTPQGTPQGTPLQTPQQTPTPMNVSSNNNNGGVSLQHPDINNMNQNNNNNSSNDNNNKLSGFIYIYILFLFV